MLILILILIPQAPRKNAVDFEDRTSRAAVVEPHRVRRCYYRDAAAISRVERWR